jgi:hypothetical protein
MDHGQRAVSSFATLQPLSVTFLCVEHSNSSALRSYRFLSVRPLEPKRRFNRFAFKSLSNLLFFVLLSLCKVRLTDGRSNKGTRFRKAKKVLEGGGHFKSVEKVI